MRRSIKFLVQQRGVTVLEFAIIAPLLFFFLKLAILEGARVFSA